MTIIETELFLGVYSYSPVMHIIQVFKINFKFAMV